MARALFKSHGRQLISILNPLCFLSSVSVPEYNLTGEFCRKHFLTGLLLRELGLALQDEQDLRHLALATLKTLMAKHSLDARYATKVARAHVYTEETIRHEQ